ncbi:MAG: Gfo/Idh/MocA family oxidoreductase [Chlorobi bacterium]|nr:Gfo/Idh/MocA family oxidoreductase [Chlorobiota bacterium]
MSVIRVSVIGCGYLGNIHARLWMQQQQAELVGVFDIVAERSHTVAEQLGVVAFDTLEAAIEAADAVTIATATRSHAEVAIAALAHSKHVLIEKPVAATLAEAEQIAAAASAANVVVHVGHVERYNPAFMYARAHVCRPLFIESHRLSPFRIRGTDVSVIHDLMIHDLDLVRTLVGEEVARLEAHGVSVVSNSIDIANVRIEFAGGCIANVTASRLTPNPLRKLRVFQQNAYFSLDFAAPRLELYRLTEAVPTTGSPHVVLNIEGLDSKAIIVEQPQLEPVNAIACEHRAFVESIISGEPAVVSLADGIEALRIAEWVEQSIGERMHRSGWQ